MTGNRATAFQNVQEVTYFNHINYERFFDVTGNRETAFQNVQEVTNFKHTNFYRFRE